MGVSLESRFYLALVRRRGIANEELDSQRLLAQLLLPIVCFKRIHKGNEAHGPQMVRAFLIVRGIN
jgi:hypothetical protein